MLHAAVSRRPQIAQTETLPNRIITGPVLEKQQVWPLVGGGGTKLPRTMLGFILQTGPLHQVLLCILTVAIFLLELVPLELQRRIVNHLVDKSGFGFVLMLAGAYALLVLCHGALKLALNVYRGWMGEQATRQLRMRINGMNDVPRQQGVPTRGTKVSMVVSEVEPIGGFVGQSISEPLLQTGVLLTVFIYVLTLQPLAALVMVAIFSPQLVFVPLLQRAINRRAAARVRVLRDVSSAIIAGFRNRDPTRTDRHIHRVFQLNMGIFRFKFTMNFLMNLSHHLQIVAALLFFGWCISNGQAEVGTLVAFVSAVGRLNDPWGDLVNYFRELTATITKYRLVVDAADQLDIS